jgi:hypothetical protein
LGLEEEFEGIWALYSKPLQMAHIHLLDREDEMVWHLDPHGVYTPKIGYIQLNVYLHYRELD